MSDDKRLTLGRRLCDEYRAIEAWHGLGKLQTWVDELSDEGRSSLMMWLDAEIEQLHTERTRMSAMLRTREKVKA